MANEIYQSFDSASTLYALVYRPSDGYIWDVGDGAFEAVGTWNDARVDECDVEMAASGDIHFADLPAVDAGRYIVQIRLRAGVSPDTDDTPLAQGMIDWDGVNEVFLSEVSTGISDLEDSIGKLVVGQQTVNNVFTVEEPVETRARILI
jgi:hypothetical protein